MKLDHYCFQVSTPREDQKKRRKKGLHGKFEKFLYPKSSEDQKKRRKKGLHEKFEKFLYPKSSEDQKKRSSPKLEQFLSPKTSEDQKSPKINQRSDADHSQIIGRIYPPIPPGFGAPARDWAAIDIDLHSFVCLYIFIFYFFENGATLRVVIKRKGPLEKYVSRIHIFCIYRTHNHLSW